MWLLDLKTVPDPAATKRLLALEPFSDQEAVLAMTTLRVARQQSPLQPTPLRRVVAAALLRVEAGQIEAVEFDDADGEAALLQNLEYELARAAEPVWAWDAGQQYRSQLLARALAHGLALPRLLAGQGPLSLAAQFHFAPDAAPLAELAAVHGLPQQLGLGLVEAESAHEAGNRERLRAGSAADALIAWLLTLGLQRATGERESSAIETDRARVRDWLGAQSALHWRVFLKHWKH